MPKPVDAGRLGVSESPELKPDARPRLEELAGASEESDDRDERDELYELDEPKPLDRLELEALLEDEDDLLEELELELEPNPELFAQLSGGASRASEAASATRRARAIYLDDPVSKQSVGCINVGFRHAPSVERRHYPR